MSDPAFDRVLAVYRERIAKEAALFASMPQADFMPRRDEFLLHVGQDVANFLTDLVLGTKAKIIVELGTSHGYSTLFFANAARKTGGKVYTYDIAPQKQAYARQRLVEAGLEAFVEFRLGDAAELLADQPSPIDVALIDLWKDLYAPCFELIYPKLAPSGVVVADNMTSPPMWAKEAAAYRAAVRAKPDMEGVLLHIGNGIDVSSRTRPAES